jgi:protein involved in polysaccharide export with SLBB domain
MIVALTLAVMAFLWVEDQSIRPNDMIEIRISGLLQPDHSFKTLECVDEAGLVRLPALAPLTIANKSTSAAADLIENAYIEQQVARDVQIEITIQRVADRHESNMLLGPGDELEMWLWNAANPAGIRLRGAIDAEGLFEVDDLAAMKFGGISGFKAEQLVEAAFRKKNRPTLVSILRTRAAQ